MSNKIKCKKCNLTIDDDSVTCPYCGYPINEENPQPQEKETKEENQEDVSQEEQEVIDFINSVNENSKEKHSFFKFPSREIELSIPKRLSLFLLGFIGLSLFSYLIQIIINAINPNYLILSPTIAAVNFGLYFITFGIMVMILNIDNLKLLSEFKTMNTWSSGLLNGITLMIISSIVTSIFYSFSSGATSNANESSIESITNLYPILSIIVFGIIGPIVEEFTYRAGLFSLLKKFGRIPAYIISIIIFGLLHFSFDFSSTENLINELINLPSYMVAGGILCFIYEKHGLGASIISHATNNLISVLLTIIISII